VSDRLKVELPPLSEEQMEWEPHVIAAVKAMSAEELHRSVLACQQVIIERELQLSKALGQLQSLKDCLFQMQNAAKDLTEQLQSVTAERDARIEELKRVYRLVDHWCDSSRDFEAQLATSRTECERLTQHSEHLARDIDAHSDMIERRRIECEVLTKALKLATEIMAEQELSIHDQGQRITEPDQIAELLISEATRELAAKSMETP